jgi:hypothetical protein
MLLLGLSEDWRVRKKLMTRLGFVWAGRQLYFIKKCFVLSFQLDMKKEASER